MSEREFAKWFEREFKRVKDSVYRAAASKQAVRICRTHTIDDLYQEAGAAAIIKHREGEEFENLAGFLVRVMENIAGASNRKDLNRLSAQGRHLSYTESDSPLDATTEEFEQGLLEVDPEAAKKYSDQLDQLEKLRNKTEDTKERGQLDQWIGDMRRAPVKAIFDENSEEAQQRKRETIAGLKKRDRAIAFYLLCCEMGHDEIAKAIGKSRKTVDEAVRTRIYPRLSADTRTILEGGWCLQFRERIDGMGHSGNLRKFAAGLVDTDEPQFLQLSMHLDSCKVCKAYYNDVRQAQAVAPLGLIAMLLGVGGGMFGGAVASAKAWVGGGGTLGAAGAGAGIGAKVVAGTATVVLVAGGGYAAVKEVEKEQKPAQTEQQVTAPVTATEPVTTTTIERSSADSSKDKSDSDDKDAEKKKAKKKKKQETEQFSEPAPAPVEAAPEPSIEEAAPAPQPESQSGGGGGGGGGGSSGGEFGFEK